jgi:type I restriction enzyme R subunit
VQNVETMNLYAGRGVAIREFPLKSGHGFADYLLFVDHRAIGAVEAKPEGHTLTGVEPQSEKYSTGIPDHLNPWRRPLPMLYQSTGVETRFTNGLDPDPRSRQVFAFHRPETLLDWVSPSPVPLPDEVRKAAEDKAPWDAAWTVRRRLRSMPPLIETGLWPAQIKAVKNLERSMAEDRPRALIQMATGSGKTYTAITSIYRLIKFGGAKRVLFLVDRSNLGRQALKEFQQYVTPDDGRKFTELYNVQHLRSNKIDDAARVVITTVQRLYSMLRGDVELEEEIEEGSLFDTESSLVDRPVEVVYNPDIPIETFDFIVVDECHRSIYNLWRQVLEYFDASIIGLTATPSKQTFGFFNQNLVMEYGDEQAVADGVNVDSDLYRIRTRITEQGSAIDAGFHVDKRDRLTRKVRWEKLDDDLTYDARQLDNDIVAIDQIRTIVRTFRDRLFTEMFPDRSIVPKTLIFAKDDSHADDIVKIVREEFGKGNDFCQKITYRTTGVKPEDLLASFRNSYNPRIVVTVDMIATGTDIRPLEIVMFMRAVKSRIYFQQMKGRGARVISQTDLQGVTRDAIAKTHYVIVDCVGISQSDLIDRPTIEREPSAPFEQLMQRVGYGSLKPDDLSSLAGRLIRLERILSSEQRAEIETTGAGADLGQIAGGILEALDPDRQIEAARAKFALPTGQEPAKDQIDAARNDLLREAVKPLAANPDLRTRSSRCAAGPSRRSTPSARTKSSWPPSTMAGRGIWSSRSSNSSSRTGTRSPRCRSSTAVPTGSACASRT